MSLRHTAASGQQPAGHKALIVSLTAVVAAGLTSATIAVITGIPPVLRTRLPYAALASRILSSSKFAGLL